MFYDIGARLIVDLQGPLILGAPKPDLGLNAEAVGTLTARPGGLLYKNLR
jgi:hypothetical protein